MSEAIMKGEALIMPKLTLYNRDGEQVSELEVQAGLFDAPLKKGALYHTALAQRARRRQGTASTKSRSFVRGGGSKPWPQKGTGRARHGSTRSPIWVGGRRYFRAPPAKLRLPGSQKDSPGGAHFGLERQGPRRKIYRCGRLQDRSAANQGCGATS